jgi:glucosyl-dolichyl phosphate glucuronosyltransferase
MDMTPDVSVIISTHNRSRGVLATLDALVRQEASGCSYDVIVVDNNSTDGTSDAVRRFIGAGHSNVRLLFEPTPGVSHGRNAGIRAARAPILAFTDDDVIVAPDWVANIKRALDAHPEVVYVSGPMQPIYEAPPPRWLEKAAHGPCVLRDRGDRPLVSRPGCFFAGWATANIAFRREVFDRVGLFSGDFPRGQDLELIMRVWEAQGCGLYAPDVIVRHVVPAERMTKAYHRMWHTREGDIRGRLRYFERMAHDGRVMREPLPGPSWFGVRRFVYRQLASAIVSWAGALIRLDGAAAFHFEGEIRQLVHYIRTRQRMARTAGARDGGTLREPGADVPATRHVERSEISVRRNA